MKLTPHNTLRLALGTLLLAGSAFSLSSCSAEDTAKRQQGITDAQQSMLDRREARQQARDERFRASRDAVLN